jgi:hypothetical protein
MIFGLRGEKCPTNSVAPSGSNEITDCQCVPGYTGPNGGPCVACVQGTFKPTTGPEACTNSANYYGTAEAVVVEASCAACPEQGTKSLREVH